LVHVKASDVSKQANGSYSRARSLTAMRLADYTDYTLRVLMYCASNPKRLVTISEIAERFNISRNHLMKIVSDLGRQGMLATTRGRGGGIRLMRSPQEICVGDVVRAAETDFRLVECFDEATNTCAIAPVCRMKRVLDRALAAYFRELDGVTLHDLMLPHDHAAVDAARLLGPTPRAAPTARARLQRLRRVA